MKKQLSHQPGWGMLLFDAKGQLHLANPTALLLLGWKGKKGRELSHLLRRLQPAPSAASMWQGQRLRLTLSKQNQPALELELVAEALPGKQLLVHLIHLPLFMGRNLWFREELQKQTHALRQEMAERQLVERRFQDIAESSSDWIWEMDQNFVCTYTSQRFIELTGVEVERVLGKRRWDFIIDEQTEEFRLRWEKHKEELLNHQEFRNFPVWLKCPKGSILVSLSGRPFFDQRGAFAGFRGTGTDVTADYLAQKQLLEVEKMAALGSLVAGVAHEINTPLGVGITAASHLEELSLEMERAFGEGKVTRGMLVDFLTQCKEVSWRLLKNLQRSSELVQNFKQLAVEQSKQDKSQVFLAPLLRQWIRSLIPPQKLNNIQVVLHCPEDLQVWLDSSCLFQIFSQLVENSLVHGFEGRAQGRIEVHLGLQRQLLYFHYQDDGVGMEKHLSSRIFEHFYSSKKDQGGVGLGMNILYNMVVHQLKGSVALTSTPGEGVYFEIIIPLDGAMEAFVRLPHFAH